ncbi:unnamed protein product [Schistosoma curassoni]|uniref:DUF6451 domain-containing protein n=1 Tax=Schistosoma curassoni TaxID=6186 RepID=A0A183JLJ7_9TREM|nr:unnamed protein product [Schistosoma curassoni]
MLDFETNRLDSVRIDRVQTKSQLYGSLWNNQLNEIHHYSVDRTTLWKRLRHYGVTEKIITIIQNSYHGLNCEIVHRGQLTDNLAILSHTQQRIRKTTGVAADLAAIGLNIHKGKNKILRYNKACNKRITLDREDLKDVKTFTYLGSIIDEHGGFDADVKVRISIARAAYSQLKNIRNSKQLSTNTKVRIFNTNVKTVLLHYQQQSTVGQNKPDSRGRRNQEEALKVDRTHIEKSTQLCNKTSPHSESSKPKEERKTKEHITLRNGDRHGKNEQQLDRTKKEGRRQNSVSNLIQYTSYNCPHTTTTTTTTMEMSITNKLLID